MKKYLLMSSAVVVIGALRVSLNFMNFFQVFRYMGMPQSFPPILARWYESTQSCCCFLYVGISILMDMGIGVTV